MGVVVQTDGKIVVVGATEGDFAVARYLADGKLDPAFGGDGRVTTSFGPGGHVSDVALQANGKVVVAGDAWRGDEAHYDFGLARYLGNGKLDRGFGGDGKVTSGFGTGRSETTAGVAIRADGRIVVVGDSASKRTDLVAVARYRTDGRLDPTFGKGGKVRTDFGSSDIHLADLALQADEKIVVSGDVRPGPSAGWDFVLARYE
jgi:uncharacterized delta-60 repeat protein